MSHFSEELWGLQGWNLLHTCTMGGYIVYTRIRLLLLISFFIFLSFQFSNIKNFVALVSGIVSPRMLKLGTHMKKRVAVSCIPQSSCAAAYSPIFSFFFPIFKDYNFSSHFSQELWGLDTGNLLGTNVDCERMYRLYRCCWLFIPLFLHFFLFNFQTFKFFITCFYFSKTNFSRTVKHKKLKQCKHVE